MLEENVRILEQHGLCPTWVITHARIYLQNKNPIMKLGLRQKAMICLILSKVVKSCYEKSSMVKYYIGDPENITLDNRKLWPLRHRIYSELKI
jgi:hypothetical protein